MQTNGIVQALLGAGAKLLAALRLAAVLAVSALADLGRRIHRQVTDEIRATLEPLRDEQARMPLGAGSQAFWIGLLVVCLSLVSALATYLILTNLTPIVPRDGVVVVVLALNLILIIAMVGVIALQVAGLIRAWRRKVPGARLHARIVALFSIITALPALLLAIAATTTFSRALDNRFNEQTTTIVQNSLNVAYAYLEEHGQIIRTDIVNMGKDLDDLAPGIAEDREKLRQQLFAQAALRDLPVAYIVDGRGSVKLAALEDERIPYVAPPEHLLRAAENGQVPLLMPVNTFRVAAVAKLARYPDSYLYVARGVDPKVVTHLRRTEQGVREYERLREVRGGLKFAHGVMYFMISLTALLAAIWVGLWFAGRFVAPIRRLIGAAQQVARGDLKVVLPIRRGEGDLRRLSENFNHMTTQLDRQHSQLVSANTQLTERRRFMEAVLSGVSAGVMGLDSDGRITLANPSALRLLGREETGLVGHELRAVVPEFAAVLEEAGQRGHAQTQLTLVIAGNERTFSARLTREVPGEEQHGSVITFDDITELVSAQRTSAWADVARRIAHEIKNPLTPIQLSAERLRRKYGKVIQEDREVFERCTDTIIRQVGDVTRMVDEFSAFARMPKPQMEDQDIRDVVRAAVLDRHVTTADITFETRVGPEPVIVVCDRRLIAQAVTNLVKNAQEAVQSYAENPAREAGWKGRIETVVTPRGDRVDIEVIDNGPGLPKSNRNRLLEPYVTTKGNKGTGLGLAIVQKSVEQHGGTLSLEDAPPAPDRTHGALVRITLPIRGTPERADDMQPEPAAVSGGR
ncbi:MAG: PAS domain-containing sensor histidine kinase [Hyphomicrobiaceae bacterium]|nr:PAS domain-containing sensor histidine kinase [Hyphomicrobiaceae bacterium]